MAENRLIQDLDDFLLLIIVIVALSVSLYFIVKVLILVASNQCLWVMLSREAWFWCYAGQPRFVRWEQIFFRSPSKSKKTKAFKFPSKKEKREKSREKDGKDKEIEKDKDKKKRDKDDKDVDKEKRKDKDKDKSKHKVKDRKKSKHAEEGLDIGGKNWLFRTFSNWWKRERPNNLKFFIGSLFLEAQPIFGVSLRLAVERSRCHDGVELPLVVRDSIDCIEESGMNTEGLYKIPGVKSKVQHLKKLYNQRDSVNMSEVEPMVAASLLILFLRFVFLFKAKLLIPH